MLAFNCLTYMNSVLKYNVKWILPSQLPSLSAAANIKTGDVTAITYACGHFIAHLASLMKDDPNPIDEPYICELDAFLTKHLLHWLEVQARLNDMSGAEQALKLIAECLRVSCRQPMNERYTYNMTRGAFMDKKVVKLDLRFGIFVRKCNGADFNSSPGNVWKLLKMLCYLSRTFMLWQWYLLWRSIILLLQ